MTVNVASKMHFNALRSLTQPCLTAYCNTYYLMQYVHTPIAMIQAFYQALQISVSMGKCIWIQSIKETGKYIYCNTLMQLRKALLVPA